MAKDKLETIILFDPDDFYRTMLDLILDQFGLAIDGFAYDLESSKKLVERIQNKQLKPDAAIIEAFMGVSEEDGKKIAIKLRELVPDIKIIGFSTIESKDWADIEALKTLREPKESIIRALEELTGQIYEISNVNDPSD